MSLEKKHCKPCEGGQSALSDSEEERLLDQVDGWRCERSGVHTLKKGFSFAGFEQTMDFINSVAHIAQQENHHPDMHVHYNKAEIELSTHAIGGLSENDFIMAARIDARG